jgi:kynurenine formamidase
VSIKILLSYIYNDKTPSYGGGESFSKAQDKCQAHGDSCNTSRFSFSNHLGTHVDSPAHFFEGASTVTDVDLSFWDFKNPQVIEYEAKVGELIDSVEIFKNLKADTDFLIIKTGFCNKRSEEIYGTHNPGFSAGLGLFLREKFPNLNMIGFDSISISSFQNREEGRASHRAFLDPNGEGNPIWIMEDMDLTQISSDTPLKEILVSPLFVEGADGTPCTIWALV